MGVATPLAHAQHFRGARGGGQERVEAADLGVAEGDPLFLGAVATADGGVGVYGERAVPRPLPRPTRLFSRAHDLQGLQPAR